MRLIDADKIHYWKIDEVGGEYEPYLGAKKEWIDGIPTVKAIPIPEGATNGDVIKTLFPNMETEYIDQKLIYPSGLYKSELKVKPYNVDEDNLVFVLRSLADWWNAPYESEGE